MATFSKIDGAEPSTVTFQLATVTQDRGGQTQHQEIVTLGGSESTLAVAQVRAAAPASTEFGLVVRVADPSTGPFVISSIVGPVTVRSSAANALVTVYQSTAADLNVTVAGYVAPSTLQTVRQSTYTDLNGLMRLADRDNSTATAAIVNAEQPASTAYGLVVRMPAPITDSTNHALRVNVVAGAAGGSTQVTVSQLLDSSGGSVTAADSANNAIRVNVVAGAAAGSTLVTVRQSTYTDFNTLSRLADRDNSTATAAVVNAAAPDSTAYGLVVRVPTGNTVAISHAALSELGFAINSNQLDVNVAGGTLGTVSNVALVSTGSITVHQGSTLFSVQVSTGAISVSTGSITVHQGSTLFSVQVSTGAVSVSTGSVTVHQGSTNFSVQARETTSSGGALEGSTASPAHTVLGLHVRQCLSSLQSVTSFLTSSNSTALYSLISSVASMRHKVFAYFVASTHTAPSTLVFMSSAVGDLWAVNFGSGSSGISGANLTVSPPGFMFTTANQSALNCRIESVSTQVLVRVSLSYFTEP